MALPLYRILRQVFVSCLFLSKPVFEDKLSLELFLPWLDIASGHTFAVKDKDLSKISRFNELLRDRWRWVLLTTFNSKSLWHLLLSSRFVAAMSSSSSDYVTQFVCSCVYVFVRSWVHEFVSLFETWQILQFQGVWWWFWSLLFDARSMKLQNALRSLEMKFWFEA